MSILSHVQVCQLGPPHWDQVEAQLGLAYNGTQIVNAGLVLHCVCGLRGLDLAERLVGINQVSC